MSYTLLEHLIPVFEKHFDTDTALAQAVLVSNLAHPKFLLTIERLGDNSRVLRFFR